jgi:hypothetical protein
VTRQITGKEAGDGRQALFVTQPRPNAELRRAQIAVASSVIGDERLRSDCEREADLADVLDYLGLYRRLT